MLSFIIPAHNEEALLGRTLQAIHDAARVVAQPYEIMVVDDASTDATAEIARQHHATVVPVNNRQIAATRNAGARAAHGGRLFFVDADTTINPASVAEALRYLDNGAVGGGAPVRFDGLMPLYIRLFMAGALIVAKLTGFTGGAFMFCTSAAFQATGGFDERLFWAEEGVFAMALKRQGRFIVLWKPVLTSPRRLRTFSGMRFPAFVARLIFSPFKTFTRRASVQNIWYDSNRQGEYVMSHTLIAKVSNSIALVMVIMLFTSSAWDVVPWSLTPRGSLPGVMRVVIESAICHLGLVLWPLTFVFFVNLFRRTNWIEWIKLAAVTAVCGWFARDSTQGVFWTWTWIFHQLAHG